MSANSVNSSGVLQDGQMTSSQMALLEPATQKVIWGLYAFQKEGDDFVEEWPLTGINTSTLQALFEQPEDDPMYDVYPVREAQAERLQAYVDHQIDLQAYDYFVECYAE